MDRLSSIKRDVDRVVDMLYVSFVHHDLLRSEIR